jgi:8-oxo-dGTP pyrophosphatase MutT (NUDIX family)
MPKLKMKPKVLKQVAALPVRNDAQGQLRVMLMTSRGTRRLIVPKGWPMKGRKDYRAAAIEAQQEAGLVGRIHRKPIGAYVYWKRRPDAFQLIRAKVFLLEVDRQLPVWPEQLQREFQWMQIDDAADLVDDPGLSLIIRKLPKRLKTRPQKTA